MKTSYMLVISLFLGTSCLVGEPQSMWADIEQDLLVMQDQVTKMQKKFEASSAALDAALENPAPYKRNTPKEHVRVEELFELESKNGEKQTVEGYQVIVHMPDFLQDSIEVTLKKEHKKSNLLVLKAKKNFKREVKAKDGSYTLSNESYSSKKSYDNRTQLINYQNGSLVVQLELPADIDVDGSYDMTFQDDQLKINFSKAIKKKAGTLRKLSLTEKNRK